MNFGGILKGALPWIGAAVTGGPAGLSALALKTFNDKLGTKAKNAQEAEAAFINATPEQRLAMKQEDDNFALQCQAMGIKEHTDIAKIDADDRASARNREIAVKDHTPKILAYTVCAFTFGAEGFLLIHGLPHGMPSGMEVIIGRILGTLDSAMALVLAYYFGSSSGSRAKDDTIAAQATKP